VLAVDAISRRTDNLPFTFKASTLCNRTFSTVSTSNNNYTYTFNSDAACSGSSSTSVGRATFTVSSFNGPAFTLQAFKNIGDATPQFSATLVFVNAFQYTSNHATPEYDPSLGDTIIGSTFTTFFNPGVQSFTTPTMTTPSISGAPSGFNVNSFKFDASVPVISNISSISFYADIVSTPAQYGSDTLMNPNSLKVSISGNYIQAFGNNLALGAYLITEKPVSPISTTSGVVSAPLQASNTDNTGGSFSWDNLAFLSTVSTSTATQSLYSSTIFQDSTFSKTGITTQAGNAQRIFFSLNNTVLTFVWDPTITYTDVGSSATRLQFGMITILFAALMGRLL